MGEFSELIKNFDKIRGYMTEFYVYGYKTRSDFANEKSLRSYDDEKRRIESYLSDYTYARNNEDGKSIYITVDSSNTPFNPLYEAFKSKSFTKNDINLHFYILDILFENNCHTASEITDIITKEYSAHFENSTILDMPVVRLKLNEYVRMGLISSEKRNGKIFYCLKNDFIMADNLNDILHFFSETSPVGVVGSYMLDNSNFKLSDTAIYFKHHHFHDAIDSEIVLQLLTAIKQQKIVSLKHKGREKNVTQSASVLPLKLLISVQTGRQYLAAYHLKSKQLNNYRIDHIVTVIELKQNELSEEKIVSLLCELEYKLAHSWNVSYTNTNELQYLEMLIRILPDEEYILTRLQREGRNGVIDKIDDTLYKYSIELYDTWEIMTWVRTFIGRIESFFSTDRSVVKRFNEDLALMKAMYGGDCDDIQ